MKAEKHEGPATVASDASDARPISKTAFWDRRNLPQLSLGPQQTIDEFVPCECCARATQSPQLFAIVAHPSEPVVIKRFCVWCASKKSARSAGGEIPRQQSLQPVTVIDVLLARALVKACFDLDYASEIETARRFAALQERRAA